MDCETNYDITIDGTMGEGGGQVLRTAITLSCILGKSLRIFNVRANRTKPGLEEHHVITMYAAAYVCGGALFGCYVNSKEFTFVPGKVINGNYTFDLQSAGSTTLFLQTLVPILWFAPGPSTIRVKGGTHNGLSPSFDFYKEVFCPLMPIMIQSELITYGFYPEGGGEVLAKVDPSVRRQNPLILLKKGQLMRSLLIMIHAKAENACNKINDRLRPELKCVPVEVTARKGPPVLSAYFQYDNLTEMITVYHQRDIPKTVANFSNTVEKYQKSSAPIGEHLADQLLLPLALIGGGTYRTVSISKHFETNVLIIQMFLGQKIFVNKVDDCFEVMIV